MQDTGGVGVVGEDSIVAYCGSVGVQEGGESARGEGEGVERARWKVRYDGEEELWWLGG